MPLESLQNGRYVPVRQLGSGSMGEVYLVEDTVIDRKVAIKIMRADPSGYPDTAAIADAVRLFKREAQAIARLEHPHILPLYDFGEEKRERAVFTYMVMPYCPEGSLTDWLQQHYPNGPVPIEEAACFIEQAAMALQYAHDHKIIHQDVKPSNFLLRVHAQGQQLPDLLLADFGIARTNAGATVANTTNAGPRGTPRYMPPEQWEGKPVAASDQYALAVTAYQLLTHTYPFQGEQMHQVMYQHVFTAPKSPGQLNPQISATLEAVILRGMAKKPEERFPSVQDFALAFRRALTPAGSITFSTTGPTQDLEVAPNRQQTPPPQAPASANQVPQRPISPPQGMPGVSPASSPVAPTFVNAPQPVQYAQQISAPVTPWLGEAPTDPSYSGWQAKPERPTRKSKKTLFLSLALLALLIGAGLGYYFIQIRPNTLGPHTLTPQVVNNNNPYVAGMAHLLYSDPLNKAGRWTEETNNGKTNGFCLFQQNAYHVGSNNSGTYTLCQPGTNQPVVDDLTFEVQAQILHGDCGGILFRGDFQAGNFYYLTFCFDGFHYLYAYTNFTTLNQLKTQQDAFPALKNNPQATILLAVVAQGSTITIYINHQQVDQIVDTSYTSGQVSLFGFDLNRPTEVVFSNARLWTP